MKLFHFTSTLGFAAIAQSGRLEPSPIAARGSLANSSAISLTSVADPTGHGLFRGERLTEEQARSLGDRAIRDEHGWRVLDHTSYRLDFDIEPSDPKLVTADAFYVDDPKMLVSLQVAAAFPPGIAPSDEQIVRAVEDLRLGKVPDRKLAWFYYVGHLPVSGSLRAATRDRRTERYLESTVGHLWELLQKAVVETRERTGRSQ